MIFLYADRMDMQRVHSGFTLVSLLIALALSSIVAAALISAVQSSVSISKVLDNQVRVLDREVVLSQLLSRDIQAAGSWNCHQKKRAVLIPDYLPMSGRNNVQNHKRILAGTDVLRLNIAKSIFPSTLLNRLDKRRIAVTGSEFSVGDHLLLSDCLNMQVYKVLSVFSNASASGQQVLLLDRDLTVFDKGPLLQVSQWVTHHYSIRLGVNHHPALFLQIDGHRPLEVVDNIDDMQVVYGINEGGGRRTYVTADEIEATERWGDVKLLRISLVLRSHDALFASTFKGIQQVFLTGDKGAGRGSLDGDWSDGHYRQLFTLNATVGHW